MGCLLYLVIEQGGRKMATAFLDVLEMKSRITEPPQQQSPQQTEGKDSEPSRTKKKKKKKMKKKG
jgi:hypothetical protein